MCLYAYLDPPVLPPGLGAAGLGRPGRAGMAVGIATTRSAGIASVATTGGWGLVWS
ncbi:MAG: hypothetical protein RL076_1537, partial [Chloroflexota bacterium]